MLPIPPDDMLSVDIAIPEGYEEAQAAKAWGIPLDQWYQKPRWARVAMMAFLQAERRMQYWMVEYQKRDA
jgi:hypothetical protein